MNTDQKASIDIDMIAEVCHEANRVLQRRGGEVVNFPWENTTESLRASGRAGIESVLGGANAELLHAEWCSYKLAEGWVYGPVKDFEAKTHPQLVPYADLPVAQQAKDALFRAIVLALSGRQA